MNGRTSLSTYKKIYIIILTNIAYRIAFTLRDCAAELQQATEGEWSNVRFAPAVRLLLDIFLKLDPASDLLPPHFFILVCDEFIQLNEQLKMELRVIYEM